MSTLFLTNSEMNWISIDLVMCAFVWFFFFWGSDFFDEYSNFDDDFISFKCVFVENHRCWSLWNFHPECLCIFQSVWVMMDSWSHWNSLNNSKLKSVRKFNSISPSDYICLLFKIIRQSLQDFLTEK